MGKLLQADLYRIFKSKLFLALALIAFLFPVFTVLLYLLIFKVFATVDIPGIAAVTMSGREMISECFVLHSNFGFILPIFTTIFICMDISNGTMRNKIIAGRSRASIYFSHLISASIINVSGILIYVIIFMAFSSLFFPYGVTLDGEEIIKIIYFMITGIFTFIFSASLSAAFTLSLKSTAPSIILSILTGMGISMLVNLLHMTDPFTTNVWMCLIPTYTNSSFLSTGQFDTTNFLLGILSYVVFIVLINAAGLLIYSKKDIK